MFSPFRKTLLALTPWLIASLMAFVVSTFSSTVARAMPLSQFTGQNLQVVDYLGGQTKDVLVDGNYAYTIVGTRLLVLEVSNPAIPRKVGSLVLSYSAQDMVFNKGLIYVIAWPSGLHIISVSDPSYPVELGVYPGRFDDGIALQDHYAYLFDASHLYVIDVAQPASPVQIGIYTTSEDLRLGKPGGDGSHYVFGKSIAIQKNYAYLLSSEGLTIFDLANPTIPQKVSAIATSGWSSELRLVDNHVYISWWGVRFTSLPIPPILFGGMEIVDVSNPLAPQTKSVYGSTEHSAGFHIAIAGTYAYLSDGDSLQVINVADPEHPSFENRINLYSQSLLSTENHLYTAAGENGLQIFDLSTPNAPKLIRAFNDGLAYASFNTMERQNFYLYATGNGGMQVLDLSMPTMSMVSSLAEKGSLLTIDNNRAYLLDSAKSDVVTFIHMTIIDITNPFSPTFIAYYDLGEVWMGRPSVITVQTIADHRLYAGQQLSPDPDDDTLYIFDLTVPFSSTLLGTYTPKGSTMLVNGNFAYLAGEPTGITVLDVTAATTPTFVSTYSIIGSVQEFALANSYLLAISDDGLHIFDISNPAILVEVGQPIKFTQIQYIATKENYVYLSEPEYGLRVLDIADPAHPTEVGFYPGLGSHQVVPGVENRLYAAMGADGLLVLQLSGAIAGKVVDSFGKPYAGVKVTLNTTQTIETDAQGNFSFASLTPGEYKVKVESPTYNFQPAERVLRVPSYSSTSMHFTAVPKPVTIGVTPAAPADLSFTDLQGNAINLNLPAGSVEQPTDLNLLPEVATAAPGLFFTGVHFDLQATQADNYNFTLPVTVTVHYTDSAVAPISDKNQLALHWWNGNQWVAASTSCPSAIPVQHDLQNHAISTAICQTGQFALFGPTQQNFLPLITRASLASDTLRRRFVAQHSGKCLNVLAESQANGANVIQWPCGNADNETWIVQPQGEYVQLIAKHSRKCLNVNGASQAEGAPVIQWSCSGGDNELWRLLSDDGSVSNKQIFQIVAKHSNQCLTVQDAAKEDLAQLVQANCSGADYQLWQLQTNN